MQHAIMRLSPLRAQVPMLDDRGSGGRLLRMPVHRLSCRDCGRVVHVHGLACLHGLTPLRRP